MPRSPNALRKITGLATGKPRGFRRVGKSTGGRFVFLGKPGPKNGLVKLTREPTSIRAEQIHHISSEWKRAGLPIQVLEHRRGRWTQQQYVSGHTIDKLDERRKLSGRDWKQIASQLGEITARMYALSGTAFRSIDTSRVSVDLLMKRIEPKLSYLNEMGLFTQSQTAKIISVLRKNKPKKQAIVVSHGDLARANVVYSKGKVILIDIDPRVELKDLDLARNLEKLRLTPALHEIFMKSFIQNGGVPPTKKDFSFMQACATIYRLEVIGKQLKDSGVSAKYKEKLQKRQNILRKKLLAWATQR